jgi:simple sugar transport system permease protein
MTKRSGAQQSDDPGASALMERSSEGSPAVAGDPSAAQRTRRAWEAIRAAMLRPELTAVVGAVAVFLYFAFTAGGTGFLSSVGTRNYLSVAAEVGIIATPITLLLIAGEFDLSVGAMMGTGGVLFAYAAVYWEWGVLLSFAFAMAGACLVGLINGLFVTKTNIPSFIITLAMMFILSGVTVAETNSLTGAPQISGIAAHLKGDPLLPLLNGHVLGLPASIYWWLGLTVAAAFALDRMRSGNWIYASGGNREAAVKTGVPVHRVKIVLFMATAAGAALAGILVIFVADLASISAGTGKEFQAAVAAVIGGALITGGYGSPIGTAFGALIFGMVNQGFFYTSIDDNWFATFVGAMLLIAVMINGYTRRLSMKRGG